MGMRPGRWAAGLLSASVGLAVCGPALAASASVDAAAAALHAGNASNAVVLATQALQDGSLSPRDRARVFVDRGLAHEALGERDGALVDFTEAINLAALPPAEQASALYDRGVTLDELDRKDDALGDYAAAIRLAPKFAAALNNRGNVLRRLGRLPEARADYLASLAADNPHPEYPNFGLGQIAEATGQPDAARGYYQAALAANSQFTLASERLAVLGTAAPDAAAAAPDQDKVHLHPPGEGVIHLHPPPQDVVHLRQPWHRVPPSTPTAPAPGLDLKPAFSEGGGTTVSQTIQLGAWRSEAAARAAWSSIVRATGNLLGGLSPQISPVDLTGKGRYYRLRAGPVYPGNAPGLCAGLAAKRLACFVVRDGS